MYGTWRMELARMEALGAAFEPVILAPAGPVHAEPQRLGMRAHVLHGNGDNEQNFGRFCSRWNMNLTGILSVRGPMPMGNRGQMWFPDVAVLDPNYVVGKGETRATKR